MLHKIRKIWNPGMYQGNSTRCYFEGWYYKIVDMGESNIWAVIPGVSYNKDGGSEAFIQILDGPNRFSNYSRYDIGQLWYSTKDFQLKIGDNYFSQDSMEIDIRDQDYKVCGKLSFHNLTPWPVTLTSPGAMGWYALVPTMECYHGVLSFDHSVHGELAMDGRKIDFTGGRGYIEKDWGKSFPPAHIWMQSNHFDTNGTSLMVSIAKVKWLGKWATGVLSGFLYKGKLYKFTTYSGTQLSKLQFTRGSVEVVLTSREYRIEINAQVDKVVPLYKPVLGGMGAKLSESLTSEIIVSLYKLDKGNDNLVFSGLGRNAGLEIEAEDGLSPITVPLVKS